MEQVGYGASEQELSTVSMAMEPAMESNANKSETFLL